MESSTMVSPYDNATQTIGADNPVGEVDTGALVAEHAELLTEESAGQKTEHPRTKSSREALERMYMDVDLESRQAVRQSSCRTKLMYRPQICTPGCIED